VGSFFFCYHNHNNGRFGFIFFLVAISTVGGGIYLPFDHKHLHNNFFCLATFLSQPLNYCDNH
jgi:hypothetical protein